MVLSCIYLGKITMKSLKLTLGDFENFSPKDKVGVVLNHSSHVLCELSWSDPSLATQPPPHTASSRQKGKNVVMLYLRELHSLLPSSGKGLCIICKIRN